MKRPPSASASFNPNSAPVRSRAVDLDFVHHLELHVVFCDKLGNLLVGFRLLVSELVARKSDNVQPGLAVHVVLFVELLELGIVFGCQSCAGKKERKYQ